MSLVAQFEIHHSRFLDENGSAVAPLPAFAQQPETLAFLYRWMTLIRKAMGANKHVIICGFGRCGQNLARLLTAEKNSLHCT